MQLAAFSHNNFVLGHSAMLINEGLPAHLVDLAKEKINLAGKTAGVLGMAFKAGSDDTRDSLSFKLRKLLALESCKVLANDPYVKEHDLAPLKTVLEKSDVIFVATPHQQYRNLRIPSRIVVIDVWSCVKQRKEKP